MKFAILLVFATLTASSVSRAETNDTNIIQSIDAYYGESQIYQTCLNVLNDGKPLSYPAAVRNHIKAAAFAERAIAECK